MSYAFAGGVQNVSSEDIAGGRVKIIGPLMVPLGEYVTIETIPIHSKDFNVKVLTINGKTIKTETTMSIKAKNKEIEKSLGACLNSWVGGSVGLRPGSPCVLRGYQTGGFSGYPLDPDSEATMMSQKFFWFETQFFVTEVKKVKPTNN
ncbi:MAG: hypothetical protein LHV69_09690 [Elusimicrobia bacterium]|nr:hypothetical protein [Candidatus Obscuribacterium magneticum]